MCVCVCVCVSLSLSLLQQRAKMHRSRRTEREKESVCCQKLQFKEYLPNTPTLIPLCRYIIQTNFIRAGFLYKFITLEGTSHLLSVSVCVVGVLGMVEHFHSRFTNFVTHPPAPQPSRPTHIPPVVGSFEIEE